MAQKKIDIYGQFRPTAADTSQAEVFRSLAGLTGQATELAITKGLEKRQEQGRLEGLKAGQQAAETGAPVEKKDSMFSVYDQAYDKAMVDSYVSSMSNNLRIKIAKTEAEHGDDVQAFSEIIESARQGAMKNVSPDVQQLVSPFIEKQVSSAIARVAGREVQRNKQAAVENRLTSAQAASQDAARLARLGDTDAARQAIDEAVLNYESLIETGDIDKQRGQEAIRGIKREYREQEIKSEFQDLPLQDQIKMVGDLQNKPEKGWAPDEWDSFTASLASGISSQRSSLKAEAKEIKEQIQRTKTELEAGGQVSSQELRELYGKAEQINALAGERYINIGEFEREIVEAEQSRQFSLRSAQERSQMLNTIYAAEAKGKLTTEQLELKRKLEKTQQNIQTEINKDALGFANKQGIVSLSPIDMGSPDALAQSMASRRQAARTASEHYNTQASVLTQEESTALIKNYSELDAGQKTELIKSMTQGLGDMAAQTFGEISKNNGGVMAYAGGMELTGGDSVYIHEGIEILKENKQILPRSSTGVTDSFDREIGQELGAIYRGNPKHRAAAIQSIKAIYASLSSRAGELAGGDMADPDRLKEAIDIATGGIIEYDPDGFGVEQFKIEAPVRGMSSDEFEDSMSIFSAGQVRSLGGVKGFDDEQAAELIRERGVLSSIGAGRYLVSIGLNDSSPYLLNEDGEPFVLDWSVAYE